MSNESWTVPDADAGTRLDKWLADPTRLRSRQRAFDALTRGRIFVDDVEQGRSEASRLVAGGMVVRLWMDRPGSASHRGPRSIHGLDVLHEDDALIVLDKPAGLLTVPLPDRPEEPSLSALVAEHWRSHRLREPLAVHRIDRDTTGVVVFARTPEAWHDLRASFSKREPLRRYLAVVLGKPEPRSGTWRDSIRWSSERLVQVPCAKDSEGAVEAVMHYEGVERFATSSLVAFRLDTGRQHQIRVQSMCHGHPLLGERIYVGSHGGQVARAFKRQALHAAELGFVHPATKREVLFEAPLPGDLLHLLEHLRAAVRRRPGRRTSS